MQWTLCFQKFNQNLSIRIEKQNRNVPWENEKQNESAQKTDSKRYGLIGKSIISNSKSECKTL